MRRRIPAVSLSLVVFACTPTSGGRGDVARVRRDIEAQIQQSLTATRDKDIDAFMDDFAPELAVVGEGGDTISLEQQRANTLRDWSIIVSTTAISMTIDSLAQSGDSAIVYTHQRWARLMLERDGVTRDTVVTTQDHREVWRRTPRGWRRARVNELGGTVIVNGKPYKS